MGSGQFRSDGRPMSLDPWKSFAEMLESRCQVLGDKKLLDHWCFDKLVQVMPSFAVHWIRSSCNSRADSLAREGASGLGSMHSWQNLVDCLTTAFLDKQILCCIDFDGSYDTSGQKGGAGVEIYLKYEASGRRRRTTITQIRASMGVASKYSYHAELLAASLGLTVVAQILNTGDSARL